MCLRITFRQIWTDLFESHFCLNKLSVVYMYAHEKKNLVFLHIYMNYETALTNRLIVLIIFVCGILVFTCVCSIARTGFYIGPNGPNATVLGY